MNYYKILKNQTFEIGKYCISPIRYEDRLDIMNWRNEQLFHLRQDQALTIEQQEHYFKTVIASLFEEEQPSQLLFSYLENKKCIGYGGLVHINWINKNAEISFVMNTELEKLSFSFHWKQFLNLIEQIAFEELQFHKIYTYAINLRPQLYPILIEAGFKHEAVLKEHIHYQESYIDVIIHSKLNVKNA